MVVDFVIDKEVHEFFCDCFLCGTCPRFLPFAIGLCFGIKGHLGIDSKCLLTIRIIRICWGLWAIDSGGWPSRIQVASDAKPTRLQEKNKQNQTYIFTTRFRIHMRSTVSTSSSSLVMGMILQLMASGAPSFSLMV